MVVKDGNLNLVLYHRKASHQLHIGLDIRCSTGLSLGFQGTPDQNLTENKGKRQPDQ